jgi:hypothetical protein
MMLRLLLILFMSLLFQACQGPADVTSADQTTVAPNFPGATLSTVLPQDGWKKLGDDLDISLLFPLPINVTNSPYIEAQIGNNTRRFYYYSGDGTSQLIFRYTVTAADLDTNGITFASSIELNGGSLTYSPSVSLTAAVPTELTISPSMIRVDGIVPYLSQVTAPTGGNYASNQLLKYYLAFSEKVTVNGVPTFNVNLTSGTVAAGYRSGSGTKTLQFAYLLQPADSDIDGFTSGTVLSLNSLTGKTITDEAGNSVSAATYATNSTNILINVTQPIITLVTPPAATTYTVGQQLDFVVTFSQAVNVTGNPALPINLNTGTVLASYLSGSGTTSLTFRYTVLTNHVDNDGISLVSPMQLNAGTIKNLVGTQNAALIYTVPSTAGRFVDAATGPFVVSAFAPTNGMYLETDDLDFTVNFSSIVDANVGTGVIRLPIIVGTTTAYADLFSGSGTSALVFRYTPSTSHEDLDGITLSGPIELTGTAYIQDAAFKQAILGYLPPNTTGILVDGTSPAITTITSSNTGTLIEGQHLYITAQFSEVVNISGPAPTMDITVGATNYTINYYSGDGTKNITFRYTIQAGDADLNGVDIISIAGTLLDLRSHAAPLTFGATAVSGFMIDAIESSVTGITPPVNDTYIIGEDLNFVVTWSEPTYLTGSPRLVLMSGFTQLYATYVASGSTTTSSIFRYKVKAGDDAPLGISTTGFDLNGGAINDASGNAANILMVLPNLSLVLLDGVVPYVTSITPPASDVYGVGETLTFMINWSEDVIPTATTYLKLTIGSTPVTAVLSGYAGNVTTYSYDILAGQLDTNGINMQSAIFLNALDTVQDIPGNNAYLQLNQEDITGGIGLTGVLVDGIAPTISAVTPPANKTYLYNENVDFQVLWSEPVTIDTAVPRIPIMVGLSQKYATLVAGTYPTTTSTFRYTVEADVSDANGIHIGGLGDLGNTTSYIDQNGAMIYDAGTNAATVSFATPTLTGVKIDGVTAIINPLDPLPNYSIQVLPYKIGQNFTFDLRFTKAVTVDTTGGTPSVNVKIGSTTYQAEYIAGSGTTDLTFNYDVVGGELDTDGIDLIGPINLNGGTIQFSYGWPVASWYDAGLNFTSMNVTLIKVDGVRPTASSITSTNISVPVRPDNLRPGEILEFTLVFNEVVTVTGTPMLELTIGSTVVGATFFGGSGTNTLYFRYTIAASNALSDLDGIAVSTTMLNSWPQEIADAAGNAYQWAVPAFTEKDYVYYSNILARYRISGNDYTSSTCSGSYQCVTSLIDITGNGNHLIPDSGATGPVVINTFGGNSSLAMQFNNLQQMQTTTDMSVKYIIVVMKSVSDGSAAAAFSNHNFLARNTTAGVPTFQRAIEFISSGSLKSIQFLPNQKVKKNGGAFTVSSASSFAATLNQAYWANDTEYIFAFELTAATNFLTGSFFGGNDFNGQIAEIILLNDSAALNETGPLNDIDLIRDQLETIHDVY